MMKSCYTSFRDVPTSSAASSLESNWQKIWSSSFRITLASTFNLPLGGHRGGHRCFSSNLALLNEAVFNQVTKDVTPVRHPHDDTLHSARTGLVDDGLEGGDERLAAFKTEAFL